MGFLKFGLMHVYYKNIFVKSLVTAFSSKTFHRADRVWMQAKRSSLMVYWQNIEAFGKQQNTMKLSTAEFSNTPIKKLIFVQLLQFYFPFVDSVYYVENEDAIS